MKLVIGSGFLLVVVLICALSGMFSPTPRFRAADTACIDGREVIVVRCVRGIGSNHYEIYDNAERDVVDGFVLKECDE